MINKIFYLALSVILTVGCSDFLEESSQNQIRPSTVTDMEKLLLGEAYPTAEESRVLNSDTDIFTDDFMSNIYNGREAPQNNFHKSYKPRFCFERNMFDKLSTAEKSDVNMWSACYSKIKGCNVILDYIEGMSGDASKSDHIKGEALALRGYYYLMLTNFFGMPYNFGDNTENLAVPLKLTSGVFNSYDKLTKNSVKECYTQIEEDLIESARLMYENKDAKSQMITRLNYLTSWAFLSRMYLYMEDYDSALKYAEMILEEKPELLDFKNNLRSSVYDQKNPIEPIWAMEYKGLDAQSLTYMMLPFTLSDNLIEQYSIDKDPDIVDLRCEPGKLATGGYRINPVTYIKGGRENVWVNGVNVATYNYISEAKKGANAPNRGYYHSGVRNAELYLIRAEVYCRRYMNSGSVDDAQKALDDLNELRRNRFQEGYVDKTMANFANADELFEFCLRERRRELCSEANHRWFDLRRLGMPEIKHRYQHSDGIDTEYILPAKSEGYQLPIPKEAIERNPNLALQ